jgi:hypothetical protein
MCPACISTAVLTVSAVISTGGLTTIAAKLLRLRENAKRISPEKSKTKET